MREFKGSINWRVRKANEDFFFVEADLPNNEDEKYYPRLEVMQEDFGDHNGYTYEMRMHDAQLISCAPEMLDMLQNIVDTLESGDTPHVYQIQDLITKATTI